MLLSLLLLGDVLTDTVQNSLSGSVLSSFIRMPGGCVEQNLARMTLPLIATRYLDSAKAWESVGVQRREEALQFILRGKEDQILLLLLLIPSCSNVFSHQCFPLLSLFLLFCDIFQSSLLIEDTVSMSFCG